MKTSEEIQEYLRPAVENLRKKVAEVKNSHPEILAGATAWPTPSGKIDDDPLRSPANMEWISMIAPEKKALTDAIDALLPELPGKARELLPRLDDSNLWLWGGPIAKWGGSLADDTVIRGAEFFNAKNIVFMHGCINEAMVQRHAAYRNMLCQINFYPGSPGADEGKTDLENAEELSRLSLKYPYIAGAMCDDATAHTGDVVDPEPFIARQKALHKYNPDLKMYCVVYAHELGRRDFSQILPYLDVVNFWFWGMHEIPEYDRYIRLCRENFPGKPIMQGIFLHEYGISDSGNHPPLLEYQLDKAREYMAEGIVSSVVILGDREIKKWPAVSEAVRQYLLRQ